MNIELTLPAKIYLLAYDLRKDRLSEEAWLDYLVRGSRTWLNDGRGGN
jgi:hypothetical protein